ncbi:Na(+)-translocating NADH-quinone reductase subunit C [Anaerohalosphaera lusitana]|uniref:Na(+)-translocating NADH-quinone reductase subunit C n=1 Tax=Anaerohalosphaera lusitana TaxID=1936003 RepID=A0A1U9NPF3_9BACT|nr:FMN-binding protein [Anaerohalosphaera lusitana]AQT69490.1 Na(+)-translocating NADH-quinone reductase subunit C [Anaerohalosphaera lusitana]
MTNKVWYPVVYMFIVTAFFSSVLIGFTFSTQERVEANEQIAFERAVLEAVARNGDLKRQQVHDKFVELMQGPKEDGSYELVEDGETKGYALPVAGKGFWAPIRGVIGFEKDRKTITGIAFYEQNETPGLGGKIMEEDWRRQFQGKVIAQQGKPLQIEPYGSELDQNEVEAITGATQTVKRLEVLINEDIQQWKGGSTETDKS